MVEKKEYWLNLMEKPPSILIETWKISEEQLPALRDYLLKNVVSPQVDTPRKTGWIGLFLLHCLTLTLAAATIFAIMCLFLVVGGILWLDYLSSFVPSWLAFVISAFLALFGVVMVLEAILVWSKR